MEGRNGAGSPFSIAHFFTADNENRPKNRVFSQFCRESTDVDGARSVRTKAFKYLCRMRFIAGLFSTGLRAGVEPFSHWRSCNHVGLPGFWAIRHGQTLHQSENGSRACPCHVRGSRLAIFQTWARNREPIRLPYWAGIWIY